MPGSNPSGVPEFLVFTLVLARVSPLVWVAPVFGPLNVPPRVRGLLALALALVIVPLELEKSAAPPANLAAYLVQLGAEALVGLTLGLGVKLLFSGIHVAGQIISQMSGLQLAEVFNPGFESTVPVVSQLLSYVTLAVFVAIGGHRQVMEGLLDTFAGLPAGQAAFSRSATEAMTALLAHSFVLGVRAAAPAMLALVLATLVLGLVSRALPQLNIIAVGLGLQTLVALGAIGMSLGAAAWVFQDQLAGVLDLLTEAIRHVPPPTVG